MTASLSKVPTISRIIDELDGSYPGINMLDIVSGLPWHLKYVKAEGVGGLNVNDEWGFVANTPEGIEGVYTCRTSRKEPDKLASDLRLHLFLPEGRNRKLHIEAWPVADFGKVMVQLSVGNADFRFPVLGYPHPYEVKNELWKVMRAFREPHEFAGRWRILEGTKDGRIFMSLMALDLYMQRQPKEMDGKVDFATFSFLDLGSRLEAAIRLDG